MHVQGGRSSFKFFVFPVVCLGTNTGHRDKEKQFYLCINSIVSVIVTHTLIFYNIL